LIEAVLTRDERSAQLYRDSMAVAGQTGTLDKRMRHTPAEGVVNAKTGFNRRHQRALGRRADAGRARVRVLDPGQTSRVRRDQQELEDMQDAMCVRIVKDGS